MTECRCNTMEGPAVCPFHGEPVYRTNAPLPPTAEQTSIARFNALADQIRELEKTIGLRFEALVGLLIDKNGFDKLDGLANRLDALTRGLVFLHSQSAKEPRAVAKKKAAPLVGKKGTGRKG